MTEQSKFELNIDKALKAVTGHFGLKLFHLIFLNGSINHGDDSYHHWELLTLSALCWCLTNITSFANMKIFDIIPTKIQPLSV